MDIKESELSGRLHANWDAYWQGFMTNRCIEFVRFHLIRRACERLLKKFEFKPGMRFCELGAGTAVVSRFLGRMYKTGVALVDNNAKALEFSRETFKGFPYEVETIVRDVFDLSEYAGCFDLVHSGGLIEHFIGEAREGIIKAHADLVKDNGYILILVPVRNGLYKILNEGVFKALHLLDEIKEVPWSFDELDAALKKYGFEIITTTMVVTEMGVLARKRK